MATLRRLALSVLFTIESTSYQTTCTASERTFNKRQHANARYESRVITPPHTSEALRQYYCSKCSYKIDEVTKFECHWADVHKKIYVCHIDPCTKWYQTSAGLRQHVHGHHAAVLTSEHCGVICLDPFLLKDHMAKHDNANFVCSGCEKDFRRCVNILSFVYQEYVSFHVRFCRPGVTFTTDESYVSAEIMRHENYCQAVGFRIVFLHVFNPITERFVDFVQG